MKSCWGLVCLFIGSDSIDVVQAMATDVQGNIYLTSGTYSANFPVTANAFQPQHGGLDVEEVSLANRAPVGKILSLASHRR